MPSLSRIRSVACLALGLLPVGLCCAKTWLVDAQCPQSGDGSSWASAFRDYTDALRAAKNGDSIWFRAGTYELEGTIRPASGIALYGGFRGDETPTDARARIGTTNRTVFRQNQAERSVIAIDGGSQVTLDGLTLTGARGCPGLVLNNCGDTVAVRNCLIEGNRAPESGAGVSIRSNSAPQFFNCKIADNTSTDPAGGGGLYCDATSTASFTDCVFSGNIATGRFGGGALVDGDSTTPRRFVACDFYFNSCSASGSALDAAGQIELRDCILCSNLTEAASNGKALRLHGAGTHAEFSGTSDLVGNISQREAPVLAPGIDGAELCTIQKPATVSRSKGRADPDQFARRDDVHIAMHEVYMPVLTSGPPAPGRWVKQTLPAHAGSAAYHCLYLPVNWRPGVAYPVLVGFPGNGPFHDRLGDLSGGMPEDNPMGFGLSGGKDFIVLGLGYLDSRHDLQPVGNWWGDVGATVDYCEAAVDWVCEQYGGDRRRVVLTGFSRSAIGASFIGLHDDKISALWRAFVCYDGWEVQADLANDRYLYGKSSFNYDREDSAETGVTARFRRLAGRPVYILGSNGEARELNAKFGFPLQLVPKPHRNHNLAWALRDTPERADLRAWLATVLNAPPISTGTRPAS